MKYTDTDNNLLAHLIECNNFTYERATEWACTQYTDNGIEPWIEKIVLANDASEILEILRENFEISIDKYTDLKAGRVAVEYFDQKINLQTAIHRLLHGDLIENKNEKSDLYVAEEYFNWHENPEKQAIKIVKPILKKYLSLYENSYCKFSV